MASISGVYLRHGARTHRQTTCVIGRIRTPYPSVEVLPAPARDLSRKGTVLVLKRYAEGLADLEGFDRIWLIYMSPVQRQADLLVDVDGGRHGVFATRCGHRPNGLGLSCVQLMSVSGKRLTVEGVDMVDGSLLLDIRPYVPDFDSFPTAWAGWRERAPVHKGRWLRFRERR